MKTLTSRDNPLIKLLRALSHSARERKRHRQTVLDGVHLIEVALEAQWPIRHLCVSEQGLADAEVSALCDRCDDVPLVVLGDALFAHVSPVDSPSGVLAQIDLPPPPSTFVPEGSVVVLDGVQDPGNLGTIVRTAACAGISDVLLTPGCAQAWSPRALRAGMGGHFRVRVHEQVAVTRVLADFPGVILATGLGPTSYDLYEVDLTCPVAWLFGGEGAGVSAEVARIASTTVRVPMPGRMESLNVGAAVAVCLFEQVRQKGAAAH